MEPTTTATTESLAALMAGLIDYAGLFPPAGLPLDEAVENYARYREGADRWLLGRFIVPATRLPDLGELAGARFDPADPFRLSILGRGGAEAGEFLDGLRADLAELHAFRGRHGAGITADILEVRLPAGSAGELDELLEEAGEAIDREGGLQPFFEATPGEPWRAGVGTLIEAIARQNERSATRAGFKLRAGGLSADAFPTSGDVAFALAACREAGVPLKATAGLHHPIRHFDDGVQARMHGFLNLFVAGVLAHEHGLDADQLQPILEDEAATSFKFSDSALAWRNLATTPETVRALRESALISYGSCSFDEPRDDLRALGLLAAPVDGE